MSITEEMEKIKNKHKLLEFLSSRDVLSVGSFGETGPWISNFYFKVDVNLNLYFISVKGLKHGDDFKRNPKVSFTTFWNSDSSYLDRKSVQGVGVCKEILKERYAEVLPLFEGRFADFAKHAKNDFSSGAGKVVIWEIKPEFIKFLNDEFYGEKEFIDFIF